MQISSCAELLEQRLRVCEIEEVVAIGEPVIDGGEQCSGFLRATLIVEQAAIRGRNYVQPDDVKRVTGPILTHRVILQPESRLRKVTAEEIIYDVVADVAVPLLHQQKTA